jgi:signal transduction histidine kinase
MRAVRYPSQVPGEMVLAQDDALVHLLQDKKDILVLDELEKDLAKPGDEADARAWTEHAHAWMKKLESSLVVPSFSSEKLLAFLVLGEKRNGDPFGTDDIALFSGLANQAALALENAMVFAELRTNEAYMVQSEKLASLGQLASGMAHEIHNPLTIISGESQLYLERFRGKDEKVDGLLHSIIDECKRAADITRRILRFAKPAPAEVSPVDLKATVEESFTLAGYQIKMDRVERTVAVPDGLPKVRSNQNQLQEVILNLIINACQAMGEKGGKLMLSAIPNGATVTLKVEDTGPGIPPQALRKVFDPFYTTKTTGTGLGLFVTQRIIKSHGGTIELESTVGKGTCFTIRLAVWKDAGPQRADEHKKSP